MRAVALALLMLLCGPAATVKADPFQSGRPAASIMPGFAAPLISESARAQRDLNAVIAEKFRAAGEAPSLGLIAGILVLSFAYGVLHAVGPGHGKMVVASYVVARRARWFRSVGFASLISLVQGISAVVVVGALGLALRWAQHDVLAETTIVEIISYALIGIIGLWMLYLALTNRGGCADRHHEHRLDAHRRGAALLAVAAGTTPCASAIIVLLFALANSVFALGIAAALTMSIGMAITVSLIGLLTVAGRHGAERFAAANSAAWMLYLERILQIAGPILLICGAVILFLGSWTQL